MKKSVATLAKEGISASDGLAMYYEKIKNAGTAARSRQHRVGDLRHKGRLHDGRSNPRRLSGRHWSTAELQEKRRDNRRRS